MKKKLTALLAGAALMLAAGTTFAFTLDSGYSLVNAPFWTNTDLTTSVNGNANFQLQFEGFIPTRDADFGLFYVNDISAPSSPTIFKIFDRSEEPSFSTKTVSFRNSGSNFEITLGDPSLGTTTWTSFSKAFGFYFDFKSTDNSNLNNTYYSYFGLDTDGDNLRNVFSATNATKEVKIYLDRFSNANGMSSEGPQMTVYGSDLTPVPEPGTMVLLGAGLLGLAIFGKRRMNKEA